MNAKLKELVDYYENNRNVIISNWKEAEVRIELINPLFECLGWDVNNNQKLADAFKEVRHEASLKIGSTIKAPDYSFNYGKRIFYLEAKTPSVNIKSDISPAYQLRRYGWTAKLPISILSDFEELAIYDCRIKPNKNDNAGVARVKYYTYKDFLEKWDEIYNFISKDAVLHGSLNNFENKQLKGTASIDDDFLNSIESWRKLLALNIALRNPELTENELNFSIQMIIDRIIFLRICEDRGIENYELLKDVIHNGNCYENLLGVFQRADEKYNSGLFHFNKEKDREETPDSITPKLKIDDKTLKDIISDLYYPDCPYELAVISSDVLGNVYERFLGKVISLSKTHKAVIDFKPEVRKAGGVYYTPHYIVEYIVKNTVGEIIKDKTPAQVSKIKICDPACGSGSFLIEAYQYLLNWHLDYYLNNDPEKWKKGKEPKIFDSQRGLQLSLSERKRILLNNIFGVDIDKNAVEVTKLSLILKVLEYEGQEVNQKSLFNERILPDLYNNIKCGNSLIGSDFYKDQNLSLFDNDEMQKINAFDWETKFPEVFLQGGFDCVIGNPPYIRSDSLGDLKTYYQNYYSVFDKGADIFFYFYEKSFLLLKKKGLYGVISNNFNKTAAGKVLRKFLKEKTKITHIIDFSKVQIFKGAITYPIIFIAENENANNNEFVYFLVNDEKEFAQNKESLNYLNFNQNYLEIENWSFNYNSTKINNKIIKNKSLREIFGKCYYGVKTALNSAFILENSKLPLSEHIKLIFEGKDIKKWITPDINKKLILFQAGFSRERYSISTESNLLKKIENDFPEIFKILKPYETQAKKRYDQGEFWWELRSCAYYDLFEKPKIIFPNLQNSNKFSFDDKGYYINAPAVFLPTNEKWLLGILNSKIVWFFLTNVCVVRNGGYIEVKPQYFEQIPIPQIEDKKKNDLNALVDQMLSTKKQLYAVTTESDKNTYQQKTDILDKQIDDLVYKLYDLSEDEIKIIENQ